MRRRAKDDFIADCEVYPAENNLPKMGLVLKRINNTWAPIDEYELDFLFAGQTITEVVKVASENLLAIYISIRAVNLVGKAAESLVNEVVKELVGWIKTYFKSNGEGKRIELFGPTGELVSVLLIDKKGKVKRVKTKPFTQQSPPRKPARRIAQ